ncbi:MAG: hypothetical protein H6Q67_2111 [Firmicutes bacterium]|nr:hypothetical protein [Bacillota bacterium]
MFEEINKFKTLFLEDVKEEDGHNLVLNFCIGSVSEAAEKLILDGVTMKDVRIITKDERVRFEVVFPSYVAFDIMNESFSIPNDYDEFTGSKAREYTKSHYLEYIQNKTTASANWMRQLKHFGFCCEWQIIDVISKDKPEVRIFDTREK